VASPNLLKPIQKREIELDFVRGLAILMVLDFHALRPILFYPFLLLGFKHFGWSGVDIFFVLSGFLVGGLLIKEWKVRGKIDSKRFLIRRGFKIWPQYYVFLFATLLTGHRALRELWGNLLNIQNYVGGIAHTWSLAVEEHAYLLLVLCLTIAARCRARVRTLFWSLLAAVLLVVAMQLYLSWKRYDTFTWTHTRVDGIFCGVLLAILYHYRPELFRRLQTMRWLWVTCIVATLLYLRFANMSWILAAPLSWDLANLMGVALLMLLYRHRPHVRRSAIYRFIAWIGFYSYGIYLWHVSVTAPLEHLASRLPSGIGHPLLWIGPPCCGIALGILTTKLVELPSLHLRDRLFPRRVDSAVGIPAEIEAETIARQLSSK